MRAARKLVRAAAIARGASETVAGEIELAVGEALAYAYEHAYGRRSGPLNMNIAFNEESLVIEIRNHGKPITPPVIPTEPPTGEWGRGLYLIQQLMDEVEVIYPVADGSGTALLMAKRVV